MNLLIDIIWLIFGIIAASVGGIVIHFFIIKAGYSFRKLLKRRTMNDKMTALITEELYIISIQQSLDFISHQQKLNNLLEQNEIRTIKDESSKSSIF